MHTWPIELLQFLFHLHVEVGEQEYSKLFIDVHEKTTVRKISCPSQTSLDKLPLGLLNIFDVTRAIFHQHASLGLGQIL